MNDGDYQCETVYYTERDHDGSEVPLVVVADCGSQFKVDFPGLGQEPIFFSWDELDRFGNAIDRVMDRDDKAFRDGQALGIVQGIKAAEEEAAGWSQPVRDQTGADYPTVECGLVSCRSRLRANQYGYPQYCSRGHRRLAEHGPIIPVAGQGKEPK